MATEQKKLNFYLPADLEAEVRTLTRKEGRTITGLMRMLLERYVEEEKEKAAA